MDLYQDILLKIIKDTEIHVISAQGSTSIDNVLESKCYKSLEKIQAIIKDDRLEDETCLKKIGGSVCHSAKPGSS